MRVIGVDPGTRFLGWGVVEGRGTKLRHVGSGVLKLGDGPLPDRLVAIDQQLMTIIAEHQPTAGAVESIFFAKNAQTAAKLGHARGVVLLALRRADLSVGEYPPARVKRALVGGGRATKEQVARIVASLLALPEPPPEDAADALAVAITHLNTERFASALRAAR